MIYGEIINMCGLVGLLSEYDEEENIQKMNNQINHRGPDDEGYWIDKQEGIYFAHKRLSIVELSSKGSQPMISFNGRYVIIYNGEIYNHSEIRKNIEHYIEDNGYQKIIWNGKSDTETLLESINIFGINKTLNKIKGMFAFAVWDKKNKEILLARDIMGEKPLYYGWINNRFFFGSELKAFKSHPCFEKKINLEALNLYFNLNYIPEPFSIYKSVFKLEKNTYIKVSLKNKTINPQKYWKRNEFIENSNFQNLNFNECAHILEKKIIEAIKIQSIADVPVGCFLSGGMDSTLIATLMSKNSSKKIDTFNIGFENKKFDESEYAKKISKIINTNHNYYLFSSNDIKNIIPNIHNVYCEPFSDNSQLPTILLCEYISKKYKTVLSGDGADELFGGYNRYLYAKRLYSLKSIAPSFLIKFIEKTVIKLGDNNINYFFNFMNSIKNFKKIEYNYFDKFLKALNSFSATDYYDFYNKITLNNNNILINKINYPFNNNNKFQNEFSIEEFLMKTDLDMYLPGDILCKIDRASMAYGLEVRTPYLDKDVVEFSTQLPLNFKINKNQGKVINKHILDKLIPGNLFNRPKHGFEVPIKDWLKNDLKDYLFDYLNTTLIKRQGILDHSIINEKLNNFITGKENNHQSLWSILIFQQWIENE